MSDEDFYEAQSEASLIKTRIVTKYFRFWARVLAPLAEKHSGKLVYMDLYSGPGRYNDGTKSTPLLILEEAISNPKLCQMLVTIFNDAKPELAEKLRTNIAQLQDIEKLKNKPSVYTGVVGKQIAADLSKTRLAPCFSFVDPFGYKGVSLELLKGLLKDWGSDLVLFFSYARINAAIDNPVFEDHIIELFGLDRLKELRDKVKNLKPWEREPIVLEVFSQALKEMGFKFVLPFSFDRPNQDRTSHYLIFITKAELAYTVMKEIMANESSEFDQGVPSFGYIKSLDEKQTPLLFSLDRPLECLTDDLLRNFAGQTLAMKDIFKRDHIGKRFIEKNYKKALLQLEDAGKITVNPPAQKRQKRNGELTFGEKVQVTFPRAANDAE